MPSRFMEMKRVTTSGLLLTVFVLVKKRGAAAGPGGN